MSAGSSDGQQLQDSPYHSDASAPQKPQRVLACNHCQHRKVKCNRIFPCNNCLKANIVCVPATPAPPRKRRAPNALLQERLKNLEALLQQYTSQESPKQDSSEVSAKSSSAPSPYNGCGSQTPTGPGKLVVQNGGYKFLDSYIWGKIYDNLQEMRHILDQDSSEDENCNAVDSPAPHEDVDLLLANASSLSLNDDAPLPFQILRLWQVFLDRVHPLTKMIHAPTTEHLIISAMTHYSQISHKDRALLYSIYLASIVCFSEADSMSMLGLRKDEAIQKFTMGLKTALNTVNFLRNYDMVVLQALVLYLISLQGRSNHDAVWILSGVIIRIAQKLGVHRDGEILGLTPFDTEMRRRVWWRIIVLDCMFAATSGMKPTLLPMGCDTKIPHNIDDADMSPESTVIQHKQGPTEMAFVLVLYNIVHFVKDHPMPDFEHILLGSQDAEPGTPEYQIYQESLSKLRSLADEMDKTIEEVEKKFCDPTRGPVHSLALALRPHILQEAQTMAIPIHETPEWGTEVNNPHDNFYRIWLKHNENAVSLYEISNGGRFIYAMKAHFHLDSVLFLAGQLAHRSPVGSFTERTWHLFDRFYYYHEELWNLSQRPHLQLARLLLKAWDARETALRQIGAHIDVPDCVPKLKAAVPQAGTPWMSSNDLCLQSVMSGNENSIDQMQMGGDTSTDMSQSANVPADWSMLDQYQSLDFQNPSLPFFSFFNSTTGW
ncbi:hypothetical protein F53441_3052 [Fusarium austroafricanum]|uniref:Zn(2)-C6 fungal-type domain-containing protein n=1 Tax=Fusarium austroafricanum TaxID=2364996 RepID=A0A8H4P0C8_9HYPO|nr:hypothetical protein F53441_3052 [Fusarium austroafricanum]